MKIAVLSDAHGNMIYFQKCIRAIKKHNPDKIIFLGDCLGYMREGDAILTSLRRLNAQVLLGNHEAMLLGMVQYDVDKEEIYGLKIDRKNIGNDNWRYLERLKPSYYEEIDNRKILYVHGCPDDPLNGYLYEDNKLYDWTESHYDYIFMGHTHYPYIKRIGSTAYVNVGAVGLPRDAGNAPSFAIINTQTDKVGVCRILMSEMELEAVLKKGVHPIVRECLMRKGKHICQK